MPRNLACSNLTFTYPKRTWSRDTRVCDPNRDKTNMQHKKQVLQYRKNSAHFTNKQRYTNMVTGKGPLGNKVWASQSETESIANIQPQYPVVSNRIMCVNTYGCNPKGYCERILNSTQTKRECEATCERSDYGCVKGFCTPGAPGGNQTLIECSNNGCPGWGCKKDSTQCHYYDDHTQYPDTLQQCKKRGCGFDCSYVCLEKECSGNCVRDPNANRSESQCKNVCSNCGLEGGTCPNGNDSECCKQTPPLYCESNICTVLTLPV